MVVMRDDEPNQRPMVRPSDMVQYTPEQLLGNGDSDQQTPMETNSEEVPGTSKKSMTQSVNGGSSNGSGGSPTVTGVLAANKQWTEIRDAASDTLQELRPYTRIEPSVKSHAFPMSIFFDCPLESSNCRLGTPLGEIFGNVPEAVSHLLVSSIDRFAAISSFLQCSHLSSASLAALILDDDVNVLTVTGLASAFAYFREHCGHVAVEFEKTIRRGEFREDNGLINREEPANLEIMRREAFALAKVHSWESGYWKTYKKRTLVVMPEGFRHFCQDMKLSRTAFRYAAVDEDYGHLGSMTDFGAVVLILPPTYHHINDRSKFIRFIMTTLMAGSEVFLLPNYHDSTHFDRCTDQMRKIAAVIKDLQPLWHDRLRVLLPTEEDQEDPRAPWNLVLANSDERPRQLTTQQGKKLYFASVQFFKGHIDLEDPMKDRNTNAKSSNPPGIQAGRVVKPYGAPSRHQEEVQHKGHHRGRIYNRFHRGTPFRHQQYSHHHQDFAAPPFVPYPANRRGNFSARRAFRRGGRHF